MKKIVELNGKIFSAVLKAETMTSKPEVKGDGLYQAVIVHADHFDPVKKPESLSELNKKVDPDRLIEARFFNDKEEHRIMRVVQNGLVRFVYRHIRDGMDGGEVVYDKSVDTTADFYKADSKLVIRNYIRKRGLLYSYDDMRFVKLQKNEK